MSKIVYAQMCQNTISFTTKCIENALPYVDHIIIVDGGSIDSTIITLRNWEREEPKLHFYLHPWCDNFSAQRNNYVKHAEEFLRPGDGLIVSDPDEFFEEKTFQNLPKILDFLKKSGHTVAGFQCRSVSLRGQKRVWENLDQYWKHLFYIYDGPGSLVYTGNPHETMNMRHGFRQVNTPFLYEHIKQENEIWPKGMRNFVIGGGGPNLGDKNPIWVEFKQVCSSVNIPTQWHDFYKYLLKGNIHQSLKDWMIKYSQIDEFDGCSEIREGYKSYFRMLHPEEEPEEFRGVHIK